jgi:GNAT superfamily N-acetyltransferase
MSAPEVLAIEAGILLHWRLLGASDVIYFEERPDLIAYGPKQRPSPFFDGVLMSRFTESAADRHLDDTLTAFGYPERPLIWLVTPSSTPADLGRRLLGRGLALRSDLPGMAVRLDQVQWHDPPPGLEIEVARDLERLTALNGVTAAGFGMPTGLDNLFLRAYASLAFDDSRWVPYVGVIDGKVVASTILMHDRDAAGLYAVAVLPEYQRRGIGGALTLRALADARQRGVSLVTLRASEAGAPMYARLGFREYCRIQQYWWTPPGHGT